MDICVSHKWDITPNYNPNTSPPDNPDANSTKSGFFGMIRRCHKCPHTEICHEKLGWMTLTNREYGRDPKAANK